MNKRLARILRTNAALYILCLAAFALAAIPIDPVLAAAEAAVTVIVFLVSRRRSRNSQQSMRQYLERITGGMDSARASNMLYAPLPMMVFDVKSDEILWGNDGFLLLTEQKDGVFESRVETIIPSFHKHWLLEGKRECPELVSWNHRLYRVFGSLNHPEEPGQEDEMLATTYWMDITGLAQIREKFFATRPVVAILLIDNFEDLIRNVNDKTRSALRSMVEDEITNWFQPAGGLLCRYDRDRYLCVFEEQYLAEFRKGKFSIVDAVHKIVSPNGISATLSIGIGMDSSFGEMMDFARLAIEMALSRGGDQTVITNRFNFEFYGGRTNET